MALLVSHRALIVSAAMFVSCAAMLCVARGAAGTAPLPLRAQESCAVREVSRRELHLDDGRRLYVEPRSLAVSGGRILLAGLPNYVYRHTASGEIVSRASDSLFGAVIERDGSLQLVLPPIDRPIVGPTVRVAPRDDGGWDAVFAEVKPGTSFPHEEVGALWHGVTDGVGWTSVEPLPMPVDGTVQPGNPSALVRQGDALAWAVLMRFTGLDAGVALFERREGSWSYQIVPHYHPLYVALAGADEREWELVAVQSDTQPPGAGQTPFVVYGGRSGWTAPRRLAPGAREQVHDVLISRMGGARAVSWWQVTPDLAGSTRYEARAAIGPGPGRYGAPVTLDSFVVHDLVALTGPADVPLWIANHVIEWPNEREVRFVTVRDGHAVVLGSLPDPFRGGFGAVVPERNEVLLSGPLFRLIDGKPFLVTLLIRFQLRCGDPDHPG